MTTRDERIYQERMKGKRHTELAEEFGISRSRVCEILKKQGLEALRRADVKYR